MNKKEYTREYLRDNFEFRNQEEYPELSLDTLKEFIDNLKVPESKKDLVMLMNYGGAEMLVKQFYNQLGKEISEEHLQIILDRIPFDSYGYVSSKDVFNYL